MIWNAIQDAVATLHPYWLGLAAALLVIVIAARNWKTRAYDYLSSATALRLCALAGLTLIYLVLAGKVAATAGMTHSRFFIFVVPFLVVMIAILPAQKDHVMVLGHARGQSRIDAVCAACGQQWPVRTVERFHNTFSEHSNSK